MWTRRVAAVVVVELLNAPARVAEAEALLDWVFNNFCAPADAADGSVCRLLNG